MTGATFFSKLDFKWGYPQVELAPDSRQLTTFVKHTGLWQYKRLMFRISSAPEIYQHIIEQALQGIPRVRNISDDIIVSGEHMQQHKETAPSHAMAARETADGQQQKVPIPNDSTGIHGSHAV